jgi:hypothetical protein
MSKGQSLIIQFVIFFLIGFSIFVSTGNVFRYQSDIFRDNNIDSGIKLANSYLSSLVISAVDTCKECDFMSITTKTQNTTAGYILDFELNKNYGLNVSIFQIKRYYTSTIHNIISSLSECSGSSASTEPISLTFNRNQNKLEVK